MVADLLVSGFGQRQAQQQINMLRAGRGAKPVAKDVIIRVASEDVLVAATHLLRLKCMQMQCLHMRSACLSTVTSFNKLRLALVIDSNRYKRGGCATAKAPL